MRLMVIALRKRGVSFFLLCVAVSGDNAGADAEKDSDQSTEYQENRVVLAIGARLPRLSGSGYRWLKHRLVLKRRLVLVARI